MHPVFRLAELVDTGCIIIPEVSSNRPHQVESRAAELPQRYTRREVQRILGLDVRRLRYWERLRLVAPQARWGERFYSFGDLVALRTIQRITQQKIPARRLRRAVSLVEQQFSGSSLPLQELQVLDQGREVLVVPPGANGKPFNPIRQQWVFPFGVPRPAAKLHAMSSKTPEQWFDVALACEARVELLSQSVEGYRRAHRARARLDRSAYQPRRGPLPDGPDERGSRRL